MYISVLERLRKHIPTYAALLRVSVSLILCTATGFLLNIFDDRKVGFEANFNSLPLLVTSLTSTFINIHSLTNIFYRFTKYTVIH